MKIFRHFHDETGQLTHHLNLNAGIKFSQNISLHSFSLGDDADKVVWCPVDRTLELYASHKEFLQAAVDRLDGFW
jgi:hypothetical protein